MENTNQVKRKVVMALKQSVVLHNRSRRGKGGASIDLLNFINDYGYLNLICDVDTLDIAIDGMIKENNN